MQNAGRVTHQVVHSASLTSKVALFGIKRKQGYKERALESAVGIHRKVPLAMVPMIHYQ